MTLKAAGTMTQDDLVSRYDAAATWWQSMIYRLGYRAAYEDLIARALPDLEPETVVDVGTGSGDLAAAYCLQNGPPASLTLIDMSPEMLNVAQSSVAGHAGQLNCVVSTLDDLKIDNSFDLVLCGHLIEHTPDPTRALGQLSKLLASHGTMLLLVSRPHWCQWFVWIKWRHRWFSRTRLRKMAQSVGLETATVFALSSGPPSRTSFAYLLRWQK